MGRHHTKPDVVVPVVRVVLVAVRTTHVPLIIVERAAAQHTDDVFGLPRRGIPAGRLYTASLSKPTAQQPADLLNHYGDMFILPFAE